MISAQTPLAFCREGKPVPTFPDHALEFLLGWRRIEFGDFRQAIFLRDMRAGDESAAHLGAVPARHDAETQRFLGFDVARRKNLHGGSFEGSRSQACETLRPLAVRLSAPNSHVFLLPERFRAKACPGLDPG